MSCNGIWIFALGLGRAYLCLRILKVRDKFVVMPDEDKTEKSSSNKVEVHYVCSGGCGSVSKVQRKCVVPGCPRNRNLFSRCKCEDGEHKKVKNLNNPHYKPEEEEEGGVEVEIEEGDKVENKLEDELEDKPENEEDE